MAAISLADLVGTWRFVRTEIPPPYNPDHEFFHFSPDGFHYWEYPFQPQNIFRFCYSITETGVRLTNRKGQFYQDLRFASRTSCSS